MKLGMVSFFWLITAALLCAETSRWVGTWDTVWKIGRAKVIFTEVDGKIIGEYPTYQGKMEGEIDENGFLTGTWKEPGLSGGFVFALSPDGESFSGRFDTGEWWNGGKIDPDEADKIYHIFMKPDLSSPRRTMHSFLAAFEYVLFGDSDFITPAEQCLSFSPDLIEGPGGKRLAAVTEFFRAIDHTTFRVWGLPGPGGTEDYENATTLKATLPQLGTGNSMTVTFRKEQVKGQDVWLIELPSFEEIETSKKAFMAARGQKRFDPAGYLQQGTPRDAIKTFLFSSKAETDAERARLARTMDLSAIAEGVRELEVQIFTEYLKSIIDRAGYIIWQEIPNDPEAAIPYTHYAHPTGNLVVAPYVDEETGETIWKFTAETLKTLPYLYEAIQELPVVDGVPPASRKPFYFRLRDQIHAISPALLKRGLVLENWQWLGLIVILGLGWLVARLLTRLSSRLLHWRFQESEIHLKSTLERRFLKPLFIAFLALIWKNGIIVLGLPEGFLNALQLVSSVLLVIGGAWAIYNFVDIIGSFFLKRARQSESALDDILVSLIASLCKLFIILGAIILLAETLTLPYRTVLAGLGIGGLAIAIAAKDTIANFFGSAVLLADRPFRRGDLVEVGEVTGTISKVGLRSTHIRTLHDSLVVIPNNLLANERINNLKHRRRRHVRSLVSVTYDTPPKLLDEFRERLLALIESQPAGAGMEKHAGVWEFAASSIDLEIFCYLNAKNRAEEYEQRHQLFVGIVALAAEMEVEFAFPTRTLYLEKDDGE